MLQVKYGPSQAQTGVLAMDEDGKLYVADPTTLDATGMANTLWCVTVSAQENGQAPKFDFENRATGMILDIATNNITAVGTPVDAIVGGDVSGWAFSRSYESLEAGKALFSYIRVKEFPAVLLELKEIKRLDIQFIDTIDIPDEISKIKIGSLSLYGKKTGKNRKQHNK